MKDLELICAPLWTPGADGNGYNAAFIMFFKHIAL